MINLVDVLKVEYEQAVDDYNAAWELYMAEFVFRRHSDGDIHEPRPPASFGGCEACREIARAGKAMDAARAKYEAVLAMQRRIARLQAVAKGRRQQAHYDGLQHVALKPKPAPVIITDHSAEDAAALVTMFAGQTVTMYSIRTRFDRDSYRTYHAIRGALADGRVTQDGAQYKFMGVTA